MVVTDYNEQFLDKRGTDHLIDELKAYIDGIVNGNIDLSDYVTKSELQAELDALNIKINLSSYATKEELTNAINSIVSSYALKTEIPNKVSELENDSGYLTEHQDLSDYARTADLHSHENKNVLDDISATDVSNWNDAKVHSQTPHAPSTAQPNFIEDIKVNGASLMISDKTVNIDLSSYAKKTEIPSTDGLATTKYVDNAISNIPTTDLTGYATEEYVNNAIANIPSGGDVDLSNYYTKEETDALIPSLSGYVTETELEAKGYLTQHQDLSNYATKDEIPDVSGFITEIPVEYVTETELSAKGYLTEHQDISGKVDKVEGKSLISDTEIARLATVDNYDDTAIRTELANKADITDIPTVDVTKSYVDTELAKKADTDHTHTTVNNHTVKSDVPENAVFTDTIYDDTEVKGSIAELNSKLVDRDIITTLPIPTKEKTYFVSGGDDTFPYTYGKLQISYGSYTGEYVALYQTTGVDNEYYINSYLGDHWNGWKELTTMDKVAKYPDWSNQQKINQTEITVDQDVYIELNQLSTDPTENLKINGKDVSVSDFSNGLYSTKFSGYVKKGSVVSHPYLNHAKFVKVFPLV